MYLHNVPPTTILSCCKQLRNTKLIHLSNIHKDVHVHTYNQINMPDEYLQRIFVRFVLPFDYSFGFNHCDQ